MANVFEKAEKLVATGLGMLERELILPRLVTRLGGADFKGAKNDTINMKIPARLAAREYAWRNNRASAIVLDDLEEFTIPVTLNKDPYSAVAVTDEELTLDVVSFSDQVLKPQIRAVAEKLESYIATTMEGGDYQETISVDSSDDPWDDVIVPARRILNTAFVPSGGRAIVLGANVEEWFLKNDLFKRADESGSTDVLTEAVLGRKGGFTIIGNVNSIDPDLAFAFHATAFAFANIAPAVPAGVPLGSSMSFEGLAMRAIQDYDALHLQDRSVVSAFAGTQSVEDGRDPDDFTLTGKNVRAVKIDFDAAT